MDGSIGGTVDYFHYQQDHQVAMVARPRSLKVRILAKQSNLKKIEAGQCYNMQNMQNMQDTIMFLSKCNMETILP
jgi:hypothetical protein